MRHRVESRMFVRRAIPALVVLGLALAGLSPARPTADAQGPCRRSCPVSERDGRGCCRPPPPPPRRNHGWGGRPQCETGLVSNEDTAGRCCWPGQYWQPSPGRCVGAPQCPEGMAPAESGDCDCADGRVRNANTRGQCCWPGQTWLPSRQECVGRPSECPDGFPIEDDRCVTPRDTERRQDWQRTRARAAQVPYPDRARLLQELIGRHPSSTEADEARAAIERWSRAAPAADSARSACRSRCVSEINTCKNEAYRERDRCVNARSGSGRFANDIRYCYDAARDATRACETYLLQDCLDTCEFEYQRAFSPP